MLDHSCQMQRHPYRERGVDLYETPEPAITALIKAEPLLQQPCDLWDPCCGKHGNIVRVLRSAGHRVLATDLVDYGLPFTAPAYFRIDFLMEHKLPACIDKIVMNAPFMLLEQFIGHALDLGCGYIAVLTRLAFYEAGTGKQRKHRIRARILDGTPPARLHVFRKRLPMMHREGWEGRKGNSGMALCWMIWDLNYTGPTTIGRISWDR